MSTELLLIRAAMTRVGEMEKKFEAHRNANAYFASNPATLTKNNEGFLRSFFQRILSLLK